MKRLHAKITYANVVSTLCLLLLVGGGTAFAAGQLSAKSVGTKQLKKNAVTTAKLRNNSVTTAKIKAKAVTASKLAPGAVGASQIVDGTITGSKIAGSTITGANIDASSTPFSQVVARMSTGAQQSFETPGLYSIGTYTQAAGEDDQYLGTVTIDFAPTCTGEREVEAILLRDAPPTVSSLEEAIPNIVGAAVIRENGTEVPSRTLEFAGLAGSGSMGSVGSATAAVHTLTLYLLRGHCGTGSGVSAAGATLDVIGTK